MIIHKTFCGIGSRTTPDHILEQMRDIAFLCLEHGYILNSGGADGADTAFEDIYTESDATTNIFLPWPNFNNNLSQYKRPSVEAHKLASTIHPAWPFLSRPAKSLIARNMHQVLGWDLQTPVEFVVCYTKDGMEHYSDYSVRTGGTGAAIALASTNNIPIYNLFNDGRVHELATFI